MRRSAMVPCATILALAPLPQLVAAAERASNAALGRDQGIFQYVAWALSQGEKLYRDVRDVNGPLVAAIHLVFQALGGGDEHRFRVLDLVLGAAAFGFLGACLPSVARRPVRPVERVASAAAAITVLTAQYLTYGFWDSAQRESFFDWFLAAATGALLVAQARARPDRRTLGWLALAGACSVAPIFGKPTYALFTSAHALTVFVDPEAHGRRRRLAALAGGGALAAAALLGFVALYGDLGAYARITLIDVPAMYRFIWPRSARALLTMPGYATTFATAATATVAATALVLSRRLPRRALAVALVPLLGAVSVLVQAKGFPYHFHPVTFGVSTIALALVLEAAERLPRIALAPAVFFAVRAATAAHGAAAKAESERASDFVRVDYFPADLHGAADWLAARTEPADRVQTYAMDAYLLFLARRLSATPFIYAYDLNCDAALAGSFDEDGPHPTPEQSKRIRALCDEHDRRLTDVLERDPPRAFVFVDRSPLMNRTDALADFEDHCPNAARVLFERYRPSAELGRARVWSRVDLR